MVLKTLRATTPSGTLDARGDIAWQPATGWKLDATLDGFDPGYFAAGWDGDIDGTIATRGRALDGGGFDATLSVPTLTGTLRGRTLDGRSEEHTSELQSLMRHSYAVFCLKKKKTNQPNHPHDYTTTCSCITDTRHT